MASLDPHDRATVERLGENWREQIIMEESFIGGIYHHLTHTAHMLWERVVTLLDDVRHDIDRTQGKFQVRMLVHGAAINFRQRGLGCHIAASI